MERRGRDPNYQLTISMHFSLWPVNSEKLEKGDEPVEV